MQKNPLHWFEIPVKDLRRAKRFYEAVFGETLAVNDAAGFKMAVFPEKPGRAGSAGALVQDENYQPSLDGSIVYFSTNDIEKVLDNINANGGRTIMPKIKMGHLGFVAHFEDSEGNRAGLYSSPKTVNISQIKAVNWFEIPVTELTRARKFYESAFSYNLSTNNIGTLRMEWFPVQPGSGSSGSLVQAENYQPSSGGSLVYLLVNDIDAALTKINANGGKTLLAKTKAGERGFTAHFGDCEGNRVGLYSQK